MFRLLDPVSFFNLDPSWRVITTQGEEYRTQREAVSDYASSPSRVSPPRLSQKAEEALGHIYNVVDLTHSVASYGKMGIAPLFATLFFVNLSTSMFFVVVWWANSFAIAFLGLMYHDFSRIEEGAFQLKNIFILMNGREDASILRPGEIPSMAERDGKIRLTRTLDQVRNAIRQIERMQDSIKVLTYFSYPLRTPLANVKANLEKIETHISDQLT